MVRKILNEEVKDAEELFHGDKIVRSGEGDKGELLDFSTNINPFGPPSQLLEKIRNNLEKVSTYPPHQPAELREKLAEYCGSMPENIVLGNGCNELIYLVARSFLNRRDETIIIEPTYTEYSKAAQLQGSNIGTVQLVEGNSFELTSNDLRKISDETKLVFLCSPNNPTGKLVQREMLKDAIEICKEYETLLVADESFIEYTGREEEYRSVYSEPKNVIVLRSLTKFYSIPGLRIGYAIAPESIADNLRNSQVQWNVNILAQIAAEEAIRCSEFRNRTRRKIRKNGRFLSDSLSELGFDTYPSDANFLLADISPLNVKPEEIAEKLLQEGIAVRSCGDFRFLNENQIRLSFRPRNECEKLIRSMEEIL